MIEVKIIKADCPGCTSQELTLHFDPRDPSLTEFECNCCGASGVYCNGRAPEFSAKEKEND